MPSPIMLLGCTSDAGKSLIATAVCRHLANQGINVAPFKAQNMSNNAAVTPDGFEIGRAQYLQALAARVTADPRMNPVLLKPSADTRSQVVLNGVADAELSAMQWLERKPHLWQHVKVALQSLKKDFDQLVIEGAGSPAEVNLRSSDIVNMAVALECNADVYLISDIDRGGAFAHLYGTWACLAAEEQALIKGFVLNKFRGDPALLGNAMDWLQEKTGIPTVANIPMYHHQLPEEDTFRQQGNFASDKKNVAIIHYPYSANMDEFDPLVHQQEVNLCVIRHFENLQRFDAVILPGSKNSGASMAYLAKSGLAKEVIEFGNSGKPVLGICGGLQILGQQIFDPLNLESGDADGLGLLDITTRLAAGKATRQVLLDWQGSPMRGYEIHHGETTSGTHVAPFIRAELGWRQGNVFGAYLHGAFESRVFMNWFLDLLDIKGHTIEWHEHLEAELDRLGQMFALHGWM